MINKLKAYKEKLENGLCEYMQLPMSERSASAVDGMIECWERISEMEKYLTKETESADLEKWNKEMINTDGTIGSHWDKKQTDAVAQNSNIVFNHITSEEWNTAMNAMYSDYYAVADKFGVNVPEFYAEMAKAFLFDADAESPREKLNRYYCYIVKKND